MTDAEILAQLRAATQRVKVCRRVCEMEVVQHRIDNKDHLPLWATPSHEKLREAMRDRETLRNRYGV